MKSLFIFISLLLLFSGCVNRRGISATYYNNCHEYYDIQGNYEKECDENIVEFETIKKSLETEEEKPTSNVW